LLATIAVLIITIGASAGYLLVKRAGTETEPRSPVASKVPGAESHKNLPAPSEEEAHAEARKLVVDALTSEDPKRQRDVYLLLEQLPVRALRAEIIKALRKQEDPEIVRAAASALAKIGGDQAIKHLQEALSESFVGKGERAKDLAEALAALGDEQGLAVLRRHLKAAKRRERLNVLMRLGRVRARETEKLRGELERASYIADEVRIKALGYLAGVTNKKTRENAIEQLVDILDTAQWEKRILAAVALANSPQERHREMARQRLVTAMEKSEGRVKLRAAKELAAHFGDAKAAPVLLGFLDDPEPERRKDSIIGLGQLPHPIRHPELREALRDDDDEVALAAALALFEQSASATSETERRGSGLADR
jgi:HEAT repeat protein